MNVGIYIYDDAEVLDFSGPFEVFSTASRFLPNTNKFNVFLISEKQGKVKARGSYSVNTDYDITNYPSLDVLIISGGVHTEELKKENVVKWISTVSKSTKIVASVCTGAFLLAKAKVITNHNVTTHWEDIEDLRKSYPLLKVHENKRWIDEKNVITSGGISAGIDMSLHLVCKLHSNELAEKTAKQMEFNWMKNS